MNESKLIPFLRPDLDILFIGLNPAKGSSDKGHYFSVNQAFWNQLYEAGLIKRPVDKNIADDIIFGTNNSNTNNWEFGITDLVTKYAESDSSKIKPTYQDCVKLKSDIIKMKPKTAVILHGKVLSCFLEFLNKKVPISNSGYLGKIINDSNTEFFNIAFPHGNTIKSIEKILLYKELHQRILEK
jgi:hypothetical protein